MANGDLTFDELYNEFLNVTGDPTKAAEYTAYQYIINPTGNIKQIKTPEKWYTDEEWYQYSAPDALALRNYSGDDAFLQFNRNILFDENGQLRPELKQYGKNWIYTQTASADANDARAAAGVKATSYDQYQQLSEIYDQLLNADKSIESQKNTHPYAQYGLPDPTIRYVVNPAQVVGGKTELLPFTVGPNNETITDVVTRKTKDVYEKATQQGLDKDTATKIAATYASNLYKQYQTQVDKSNLTPFVYAAARRARLKK